MNWLTPRWLKDGPGIDRNAPPKQGFALLLGAARVCFKGRPSFLDIMTELTLSRSEAEARRRDVTVDDERRREDQRRDRDQRPEEG